MTKNQNLSVTQNVTPPSSDGGIVMVFIFKMNKKRGSQRLPRQFLSAFAHSFGPAGPPNQL
ncbi:hypothetical protein HMPREF1249_1324 [Jonquetella sp. BV3C21]|nr:hypothetical protein HMPREF1249_1324 [Jonquetella sp. BV3C21]